MSNVSDIPYIESELYRIRHSSAHVMAEAVLEYFPEAKLAIGPPIEDGFYYDFDLGKNENGKHRPGGCQYGGGGPSRRRCYDLIIYNRSVQHMFLTLACFQGRKKYPAYPSMRSPCQFCYFSIFPAP